MAAASPQLSSEYALAAVQKDTEAAILGLKPVNPVNMTVSSRTDKGVHALCNSAHFDLQRRDNKEPFTGEILKYSLNYHLKAPQIRVIHAVRVSPHFHSRFKAQSRTYLYRVILGSPDHIPLSESDVSWNLGTTELDVDAMREAAAMLEGTHDFSSFRAINKELQFKNPVKTMDQISIEPGSSSLCNHFNRNIKIWELTFRSRSFLYQQVRRMTGALVAVGRGHLSLLCLKKVLDAQDSRAFPTNMTAPARGLFLANVEYSETDLLFPTSSSEESQHPQTQLPEQDT